MNMKAFTKGEAAILVRQYDDTTFSFRRVIVVSCGAKRMTLKDAATDEMLGTDFDALVGFGSIRTSAEWINEHVTKIGRPLQHCFRTGVFKDMPEEAAEAFVLNIATEFFNWETTDMARKIQLELDEYGATPWYKSRAAKLAIMIDDGPSAKRL